MEDLKLGIVEEQFADIIWNNEPLQSGSLVKICEKELCWKKSTTYTVLRKLCDRGIFKNENGTVSSFQSRNFIQFKAKNLLMKLLRALSPHF